MDATRNIFKEFNFSVATSKNDLNYKKNSHKPTMSKRSHIRKKSISIMTNGDSRLHVTLYHNKKKVRSTTGFVFIINKYIILYLWTSNQINQSILFWILPSLTLYFSCFILLFQIKTGKALMINIPDISILKFPVSKNRLYHISDILL